jgi:hypothetical protein
MRKMATDGKIDLGASLLKGSLSYAHSFYVNLLRSSTLRTLVGH